MPHQLVADLCDQIVHKFFECTRYTKTQLNFWKDFSWHMTIGHARDWLAIHNRAPEVQEGCNAFLEKRPVDYDSIREKSKW